MEPTDMKELVIDADGHVLEPPDVWQRYIDPAYRARAIRVRRSADGRDLLEIDGRPASLTTPEMLGGFGGMGKTMEELAHACLAGRYAESAPAAAVDPAARLALLDRDGIDAAILYPSLGLQWEAEVADPAYALAHCRAYNRWIEEFAAGSGGRLVPIAHLSLGDPHEAARELRGARRLRAALHAERSAARPSRARPALGGGAGPGRTDRDSHRHRSARAEPAPPLHGPQLARGRAGRHLVPRAPLSTGRAAGVLDVLSLRHLRPLPASQAGRPRVGRRLARLLGRPHGRARTRGAARHVAVQRAAEHVRAPAVLDIGRSRRAGLAAD